VTLWDMDLPFYPQMQWTHPSSLAATKCKVCRYAGRLWHLYSVLQDSSELSSWFDIQKWMWTCAVTCCADCIRLLAGRGKNIWHQVWSFSTIIPIQYTTNTRSCCSLETYGKSIIWCWPCALNYYFWQVPREFQGQRFDSKIVQEPNFCQDNCRNLSKMIQEHQGAVGLCQ